MMKVFHMKQSSREWFDVRRGRITASEVHRIITPVTGAKSKQSIGYARQLIGELKSTLYPFNAEWYTSRPMQHGIEYEVEARNWLRSAIEREHPDVEVEEVGFAMSSCGRFGFSPDALIPDIKEGVELKCPYKPEIQLERLDKGVLWPEVKVQVHAALAMAPQGWKWNAISYHPGLPALRLKVEADDYTAKVKTALEEFWVEYAAMLAKFGIPYTVEPEEAPTVVPECKPDGEIVDPNKINAEQFKALAGEVERRDISEEQYNMVLDHYQIKELRDLPRCHFQHCLGQLRRRLLKETL